MGDGDAAEELKTRATVLGILTQVVFERSPVDLYSYLKSADVLLIPDADELSDELAIQGGVAGIPIVMVPTEKRRDLFEDSVSALFCVPDDNIDMSNQIKKILNDLGLRAQLKFASQQRVTEKLHEDPETYRLMFRDSIEAALFPEDSESSAE